MTEYFAVIGTRSTVRGDQLLCGHVPDPFPWCGIGSGHTRLEGERGSSSWAACCILFVGSIHLESSCLASPCDGLASFRLGAHCERASKLQDHVPKFCTSVLKAEYLLHAGMAALEPML